MNTFDAAYQQAVNAYKNAANMPVKLSGSDATEDSGSSFAGFVSETLRSTTQALRKGEHASSKALVNEADITDVVTSVGEAEIALQTVITLRDKMISAYQDIIKMPI